MAKQIGDDTALISQEHTEGFKGWALGALGLATAAEAAKVRVNIPGYEPVLMDKSSLIRKSGPGLSEYVAGQLTEQLKVGKGNLPSSIVIKDEDVINAHKYRAGESRLYVSLPGAWSLDMGEEGGSKDNGPVLMVNKLSDFYKYKRWDDSKVSGNEFKATDQTAEEEALKDAIGEKGDAMAGRYNKALERWSKRVKENKPKYSEDKNAVAPWGLEDISDYVKNDNHDALDRLPKRVKTVILLATEENAKQTDIDEAVAMIIKVYGVTEDEAKTIIGV